MKKEYFILSFVAIVLIIMVYSNVTNNIEHKKFLDEMSYFKNKGGRNTSDMGAELCNRINILEFHLKEDVELIDCDAIYE